MKKTKTNIPELRFPSFEGEWEEKKLGEILSIGSGKDYKHLATGLIPVFGTGGYMTSVDDFLYDGETVCIGRKGTIDSPMFYSGKLWTVDTLFYTHSFKKTLPKYVYQQFLDINWKEFNEATGVPSLSKRTIENVKIYLPDIQEQDKIAKFLEAVDQKIEQLEKMVALQEKYKKGMMQRIFNQEIRFKSSNGTPFPAWQQKKLGDISTINPISKELPLKFIYIDLESVSKGQLLNEKIIERDNAPIRAQRLLLEGDIIFQSVRPYQRNNLFFKKELKLPAVASTGYVQIRTKINSEYLFFALHTDRFNIEVLNACTGTSYPAISASDLANIKVIIPVLEEQKKIAGFLSALDEKIVQSKTKLDKVREWKIGLMQRLFI